MAKNYARIESEKVVEVFTTWDPSHDEIGYYHNTTYLEWAEVPEGLAVTPGWGYVGGVFVEPTPEPEPEPTPEPEPPVTP